MIKKIIITALAILTLSQTAYAAAGDNPLDDFTPSRSNETTVPSSTSTGSGNAGETQNPTPTPDTDPTEPDVYEVNKSLNNRGETILPPLPKPDFLPGPNLTKGDEGREYITEKLLPKVSNRLVAILSVLSMLGLIYSGILFFTSFGEQDKITKARKAALFSVVGLILALLSFTVVQIINLLPIGN